MRMTPELAPPPLTSAPCQWDDKRGIIGEVRDITRIQICLAIPGRKRLRSVLDGFVCKSSVGNRPASPQSFKLSLPAEQYGMFYVPRVDRYSFDLQIGRRKCSSSKKIVWGKVPPERCNGPPDATVCV
ncbi:hypothetical protein TNCV_3303621 [Trichonephila clavipes]|nr:hypothetical protein TNCV_3303621 [Trichonephila clavipes]